MIAALEKITALNLFSLNEACLSGTVDVIAVQQKDGSYKATPFHVRFGKFDVLNCKDKVVKIEVNNKPTHVTMKLGGSGEAYFEEEVFDDEGNYVNKVEENLNPKRESNRNPKSIDLIEQDEVVVDENNDSMTSKIQQQQQQDEGFFSSLVGVFKKNEGDDGGLRVRNLIKPGERTNPIGVDIMKYLNEKMIDGREKIKSTFDVVARKFSNSDKENEQPNLEVSSENDDSRKFKSQQSYSTTLTSLSPPANQAVHFFESDVISEKSLKKPRIKKTLRLSSEKLQSFNLRPGLNTITFIVSTDLQSTQKLSANIYLWQHYTKIIITDIDGTVTKSDVLGAILPMLGKDWSQPGIVPLFSNIRRNGYQIIYLTSRAIGQIGFSRHFVATLKQDALKLPDGPIISSPDRLLTCFRREFVQCRPEYYKAAALRDIKNLFPEGHNPFYAAFGNRESDAIAYRFVGIPLENIFSVNQDGEVHHYADKFKRSYAMMNSKLKELFPCTGCYN